MTYEPVATDEAAGLWATPPDVVADPAVLYIFGGGHVITSTCSGQSFVRCRDVDLECTRESLLRMEGQYLAGHDPTDPAVSPVFADAVLARCPPPCWCRSAGTRCC